MKNPFIADENAGVLGLLTGLIIVVFVALGLSLLVNKEISLPSSANSKLRIGNDQLQSKISRLEIRIEGQKRASQLAAKNREQATLLSDIQEQIGSANEEIKILDKLISSKQTAITLIEQGKKSHSSKYRDHVRAEALGKTFDSVVSRLGKEYEGVRIMDISEVGVTIGHRHGVARLDYSEMPKKWKTDLMFSAAEVAKAKLAERKHESDLRKAIAAKLAKNRKKEKDASSANEIEKLRRQIATVSMRLASAQTEASLANNKLSYQRSLSQTRRYARSSYRRYNYSTGSYSTGYYRPRYRITLNTANKSVPGSLETWEQRATRYQRVAARYSAQLSVLQSRLQAVDPTYYVTPEVNR
ncbi:MAG: hypothetical protein AB8F34_01565 [Akkermansiaceae bacterium]